MADNFPIAHQFTARWEGEAFTDHPADRGGPTKFGVSLAFLQELAAESQAARDVLDRMGVILPPTRDTIKNISATQAAVLFRWRFWNALKLDGLPRRPAIVIYDAAVNHGPSRAVLLAQRGYNACVGYGVRLAEDGVLGSATRKAMQQADTDAVLTAMLAARQRFYDAIVARDASQAVFLRGWLRRVDALARYIRSLA